MNEGQLGLGLLLLGLAALAGFIAFRPWPASPHSNPITAGAYVIEILQGNPPAASLPEDHKNVVTEIQQGLTGVVLIWLVSRVITGIFSFLSTFANAPGSGDNTGEDDSEPDATDEPPEEPVEPGEGGGGGILGDIGKVAGEGLEDAG